MLSQRTGCIRQLPSCREVVEMQLLSEVHFSIHLCFIVLIANKPYVYFSFLFFFFLFQWGIQWSCVCHGKRSEPWLCFIHSWFTCSCTRNPFFLRPAKSVEFVISKKKIQNTAGPIRPSFKICLPVLSRNPRQLRSGFVHSGGHCITQNTSICHRVTLSLMDPKIFLRVLLSLTYLIGRAGKN